MGIQRVVALHLHEKAGKYIKTNNNNNNNLTLQNIVQNKRLDNIFTLTTCKNYCADKFTCCLVRAL
jgi:hypothetical protein